MNGSTEPTGDAELLRLLDTYGSHRYAAAQAAATRRKDNYLVAGTYLDLAEQDRAALLAYIAARYICRGGQAGAGDDAMTQTTAEQRAELRRLIDAQEINAHYRSDYPEHAAMVALLNAGPALLADAEALAEREAEEAAPDPPIVAGPLSRVPVTIRLRKDAD